MSVRLVIAAVLLAGCSFLPSTPVVENGWIVPTPFPLPPGAQPIEIDILRLPRPLREDTLFGCPRALLSQVRVEHQPGAPRPVRYTSAGRAVWIAWQEGFSARLNPTLEVVAPDGTVVLREGGEPVDFGGGALGGEGDEAFAVCLEEYVPRRADAPGDASSGPRTAATTSSRRQPRSRSPGSSAAADVLETARGRRPLGLHGCRYRSHRSIEGGSGRIVRAGQAYDPISAAVPPPPVRTLVSED